MLTGEDIPYPQDFSEIRRGACLADRIDQTNLAYLPYLTKWIRWVSPRSWFKIFVFSSISIIEILAFTFENRSSCGFEQMLAKIVKMLDRFGGWSNFRFIPYAQAETRLRFNGALSYLMWQVLRPRRRAIILSLFHPLLRWLLPLLARDTRLTSRPSRQRLPVVSAPTKRWACSARPAWDSTCPSTVDWPLLLEVRKTGFPETIL